MMTVLVPTPLGLLCGVQGAGCGRRGWSWCLVEWYW
jgi:hypothetical protein